MRSLDKGITWEDRKEEAQVDGHTLRMHAKVCIFSLCSWVG